MREIKFRGKRIDNGEWVCGYYVKYEHMGDTKHIIITNWAQVYVNSYEIDPETVGQYTGLKDKNGVEIYEGDIVDFTTFDHNDIDTQWRGVVKFSFGGWQIWNNGKSPYYDTDGAFELDWVCYQDEEIEVIGNIHDNPELLT